MTNCIWKPNMCWLYTSLYPSTPGPSTDAATATVRTSSSDLYECFNSKTRSGVIYFTRPKLFKEQSPLIIPSRWRGRRRKNLDSAVSKYRLVISQKGFSRSLFLRLRELPALFLNDWDWRAVGIEHKTENLWNVQLWTTCVIKDQISWWSEIQIHPTLYNS